MTFRIFPSLLLFLSLYSVIGFTPTTTRFSARSHNYQQELPCSTVAPFHTKRSLSKKNQDHDPHVGTWTNLQSALVSAALGLVLATTSPVWADAGSATYDGFAEYAKENQMEKSDVSCFVNKCGDQTKNLFSNPRGIKGVTCLGRCKGEQTCAMRCFAEFGSEDLNNWLSCTIEDYECVKVPKNIDNSAENVGYTTTVKKFDPKMLIGTWYKTDGLNPNYDLFDCQTNTFKETTKDASELDMGIFFRVQRPPEAGGGFWENALTEHMVVDAVLDSNPKEGSRTGDVPPFVLVAYKGHTLQGNYEGSFVYAKEPILPEAAIPAIKEAAARAGLNWNDYQRIDNTW